MNLPLILATANPDKAREICEILTDVFGRSLAAWAITIGDDTVAFFVTAPERLADELPSLPALSERPDVEETGATLEENARIKASALVVALGLPAIADDTGLEIDALGGAPGARAARFAGENASYADNVDKVLRDMEREQRASRTGRFATVALARWPDGRELVARGAVEGTISDAPRGTGGFGYDPIFLPAGGHGRTFAELAPDEKHALSHRGRAFRVLAKMLAAEGE